MAVYIMADGWSLFIRAACSSYHLPKFYHRAMSLREHRQKADIVLLFSTDVVENPHKQLVASFGVRRSVITN